jgi:LysM repeat protein
MVIIDAGHGGSDPGGGSNQYWKEKDLNLKISLYEYERLRQLGVPVSLTRDSDISLNPTDRVLKVYSLADGNNDILISNHINVDYGKIDGAEVIYSIKDSDTFAKLIASNLQAAGQNLSPSGVYTRTNELGNDYYYIIRNVRPIKSVLVEFGFADSPGDDITLLRDNWQRLAEAVVKSVAEFLGYPYSVGSPIGKYTVIKGDTLYSIANKFNMSVNELKNLNSLTSNTIYPGQVLSVYPSVPSAQTITYVVKKGDSLYSIAKSFGTTVDAIKNANGLTTDNIYTYQSLIIPLSFSIGEYLVKKGDTLYSIASKYNISVETLKALNNLGFDTIYPYQALIVPKF